MVRGWNVDNYEDDDDYWVHGPPRRRVNGSVLCRPPEEHPLFPTSQAMKKTDDDKAPECSATSLAIEQCPPRPFEKVELYVGLSKYFEDRSRFRSRHSGTLYGYLLSENKVLVSWTPRFHFARRERDCRSIFMLLLLCRYDKLSVPYECLALIINWFVLTCHSVGVCRACRRQSLPNCILCGGKSAIFVDCADLVKFM